MQGIFVEYGITVDDDATEIRNGGLEVLLRNSEKKKCNVLAEHISQSLWMKSELECKKSRT